MMNTEKELQKVNMEKKITESIGKSGGVTDTLIKLYEEIYFDVSFKNLTSEEKLSILENEINEYPKEVQFANDLFEKLNQLKIKLDKTI